MSAAHELTAAPAARSAAAGYLIALVAVALATWLRVALDGVLGDNLPYISYFLAVLAVAWATSLGPSLVAFAASLAAGNYFFIPPRHTVALHFGQVEQQLDLARFLIIGVAIIAACEAMRRDRLRADAAAAEALESQRRLEREVAERLRAQNELKRLNEELERRVAARTSELRASNTALERSNRELEQFASVASHDLQEPLRKVQAFGDRLNARCGDSLGPQGMDYLDRILAAAARMRTLIDDLLAFSRIATKAQPSVAVALGEIARAVASDLEGRLDETGGRIEIEATLPTIEADPLQMRQLFTNLIGNGLKFRRPQEPPVVMVGAGIEGDEAILSFTDNGIGFERQYVDRIFEVFQRLHGRDVYEGTGIGLAICRKIVERHGGTITATSTPGRGSTFVVTVPLRQTKDHK